MIEVMTDINKNDEVYAKKELKMFGHIFANEGDYFKIGDISDNQIKLTSDKIDLMLDINTFSNHFEKKKIEVKNSNKPHEYDIDKIVESILEHSTIYNTVSFDRCLVVSCKLPSGFIITETSYGCNHEELDTEKEFAYCIDKIKAKIAELETYRIMVDEYEYDCWSNDFCCCDCHDCYLDDMPECFDLERCYDCEDQYDCDCFSNYVKDM